MVDFSPRGGFFTWEIIVYTNIGNSQRAFRDWEAGVITSAGVKRKGGVVQRPTRARGGGLRNAGRKKCHSQNLMIKEVAV